MGMHHGPSIAAQDVGFVMCQSLMGKCAAATLRPHDMPAREPRMRMPTVHRPRKRHVDRQAGPAAALHFCRAGSAALHRRAARDPAHADGYLPEHRHSRRQHRLVVQRLFRRRHGASDHVELRACAHERRRRYRAHRIAIAEWRIRREGVLPSGRRHQSRDRRSRV